MEVGMNKELVKNPVFSVVGGDLRQARLANGLAELGYTNIYEFGGINTWPYEIEK